MGELGGCCDTPEGHEIAVLQGWRAAGIERGSGGLPGNFIRRPF